MFVMFTLIAISQMIWFPYENLFNYVIMLLNLSLRHCDPIILFRDLKSLDFYATLMAIRILTNTTDYNTVRAWDHDYTSASRCRRLINAPLHATTWKHFLTNSAQIADWISCIPFDRRVVCLLIWASDGVDETVEGGNTDSVAGDRHVATARPAVGRWVKAIDGRRVLMRGVRGIVATTHHVDLAVHLNNRHPSTHLLRPHLQRSNRDLSTPPTGGMFTP